jgi:tetratricopeptide (TPR) repeat protein
VVNVGKKLLVIAAKGPARSVPVIGGILADLVGLADTETGDQIEDLKRLVRSLEVRLKGQVRVSDALLAALGDADESFRKPIEELAYAVAHPDAPPKHVEDSLKRIARRFRTAEKFVSHCKRVFAPQEACTSGEAVVVQIQGDYNVVLVSPGARLELETPEYRRQRNAERVQGDLRLLMPDAYVSQCLGRDEMLDEFLAWTRDPAKRFSARALVGGPGAGKTRFALELLRKLGANQGEPHRPLAAGVWCGGFLRFDLIKDLGLIAALVQCRWPNPMLFIVDYAAAAGRTLRTRLDRLASPTVEREHPVRVLLLERERRGGWFEDLVKCEHGTDPGLATLFDPPQPIPLPPLPGSDNRRAIYSAALVAFAGEHKTPPPDLPPPDADPNLDRQLAEDRWGDPLYLMMAAAVAALSDDPQRAVTVLSLSRTRLAEQLAGREVGRLTMGAADGAERNLRPILAALATLARGLSRADALTLTEALAAQTGYASPAGEGILVDGVARLLPGEKKHIGTIAPDIIGEAFIHMVLGAERLDGPQRLNILLALLKVESKETLEMLVHLMQDFGSERPGLLDWFDDLVRHADERDFELLLRVAYALPEQSLLLTERAAAIQAGILERLRATTDPPDPSAHADMTASSLNNLGNRLSALGRHEEALASAQEAVDIRRRLAAARPDVYTAALASSLNNLGNLLSALGRHEEALASAQEAVDIRRRLAAARPEAYTADLAMSLNNLGNPLSDLGRHEEALACAQEAADLYRRLAAARPDAYTADLAISLNNLGKLLGAMGRHEEALASALEAMDIRRRLAAARPDAYTADLAISLNNLGTLLSVLGRHKEALASALEAADLYRRLAAARPDAYTADLAMSLNNLGVFLSDLDRHREALASGQEAADLFRRLAAARPDAYTAGLATALNNMGNRFSALGRHEEALASGQEAVDIRRRLAAARPDAYTADLATSLGALHVSLMAAGRKKAALESAAEGLQVLRPAFLTLPQAHARLMGALCGGYLALSKELGREPRADILGPVLEVLKRLSSAGGEAQKSGG